MSMRRCSHSLRDGCFVGSLAAFAADQSADRRRGDAGRQGRRAYAAAQKADVNAPQADGATALHWAVYRSDSEWPTC